MAEGNQQRSNSPGQGAPGGPEAREQGESGHAGARAAQTPGSGQQPPQGSNRTNASRQEAEPRTGFEPGHAPSEQGEMEHRSAQVVAQHQQGAEPRSGSHARGDRSEETARQGEPREEHTAHGRHDVSGSREGNA